MDERFETFTALINRISRNIRKIKNRAMADHKLKSAHISCLYYLCMAEGLTATDLCERCEEDKATISRALLDLEKDGYLVRETEPSRRYKSPLFLTEKGRAVGREIADKISVVLDVVSHGLSDTERRLFYRCLAIISRDLDQIANTAQIT